MIEKLNKKIRRKAEKLKRDKNFPAYVSGAEYNYLQKVEQSGKIKEAEFVKSLKNKLEVFGKIGTKYNGSSVGYCAETVSANKVLKKFPSKLKSLNVGIAIRPRTLQEGKKCKICKSVF